MSVLNTSASRAATATPEPRDLDGEQFAAEADAWRDFGVVTLPAKYGTKGEGLPADWPNLTHAEAWALTERAARAGGPRNLMVRLGPSESGRILAHLDFDGRHGVDADEAYARAVEAVPALADAPRLRTRPDRLRLLCWVPTEIPAGEVAELGAEVEAGAGRLSVVAGRHPLGHDYRWEHLPEGDLPLVDLAASLDITSKATPANSSKATTVSTSAMVRGRAAAPPAPIDEQHDFRELLALVGVTPGSARKRDGRGGFHVCPFHGEGEASLHVDFDGAVLHCFGTGCEASGHLSTVRWLLRQQGVAGARGEKSHFAPSILKTRAQPLSEGAQAPAAAPAPTPLRLTGRKVAFPPGLVAEYLRQAAALWGQDRLDDARADICRALRANEHTAEDGTEHAWVPTGSSGAPLRYSCGLPACPRCSPARLLRNLYTTAGHVPDAVALVRIEGEGDRRGWLRRQDLEGWLLADEFTVDPEAGTVERGLLLAVRPEEAANLKPNKRFTVSPVDVLTRDELFRELADRWRAAIVAAVEAGMLEQLIEVAPRSRFTRGGAWRSVASVADLPHRLDVVEVAEADRKWVRSRMRLGAVDPEHSRRFALPAELAVEVLALCVGARVVAEVEREAVADWRIVAPLDAPNTMSDRTNYLPAGGGGGGGGHGGTSSTSTALCPFGCGEVVVTHRPVDDDDVLEVRGVLLVVEGEVAA